MDEQTAAAEAQPTRQPGLGSRALRWLFRTPAGLALVAAVFVGGLVGGTVVYHYTESTKFCTTCHTMIPQKKAHAAGFHTEVSCAECHVAPGVQGYVRAKIGGIQELLALVTNTYERPIHTPDRFSAPLTPVPGRAYTSSGKIPSAKDTCSSCHPINKIDAPGKPTRLIVTQYFASDEQNTSQFVAIRIRPSGEGSNAVDNSDLVTSTNPSGVEGVHWHITKNVTIYNSEGANGPVPMVEVQTASGKTVQFVSAAEIGNPATAGRDVERLKVSNAKRSMDCVDCHNRVGHDIKSVDSQVDAALANGKLPAALPYIKREAVALISSKFSSDSGADTAIENWAKRYASSYNATQPSAITAATAEIKRLYHLLNTPAMNASSASYVNNLGHASGAGTGCFRCHDGMHVKVVDGKATDQIIPSTCSTCHSFPMVASTKVMLPTVLPPTSHKDNLYVFNHKNDVASVAAAFGPSGTCKQCHQENTCTTCHNSKLGKVKHTDMLFNHASMAKNIGVPVCATCHQKEFCAQCHGTDITNQIQAAQASIKAYISDLT